MNDELTELLKGRVLSGTSDNDWKKTITFEDGAILTLKHTPSSSNSASTGGTVESAELTTGTTPEFHLHLDGGTTVTVALADEEGNVRFQDHDGNVRYEN